MIWWGTDTGDYLLTSEEPASETVSENASETPTKASAPDASTEA